MRLSEPTTASLTWRGWLRDGQRLTAAAFKRAPFARLCESARATVGVWQGRVRSRRALAALDARMLKDIAMTPAQASREARKPFWRA